MKAENEQSSASGQAQAPAMMTPGLYVIATPIGNLGDITFRAVSCLNSCALIACEDTRVTGRLLDHLSIRAQMVAYHEHSAAAVRPRLMAELEAGKSIALVSDAGTPCLADPGFKLVQAATAQGFNVFAVPGASSITAALSIAGLPTDRHYFEGFLPNRAGERQRRLQALAKLDATLVVLESPHRIVDCLDTAIEIMGDRPAALARELTKRFEEVLRGTLSTIRCELAGRTSVKGEIVLLIERASDKRLWTDDEVDDQIRLALMDNKPSRVAAIVSQETGLERDHIYKRVLALKSS